MLVFAFLRRRETTASRDRRHDRRHVRDLLCIGEAWAFQYFAWSMPFWMLAGWRYAIASHLFGGGYIYAFYAFVCGDWLLRPKWRPLSWPPSGPSSSSGSATLP